MVVKGFRWRVNTLTPGLAAFSIGANYAIGEAVERLAEDMEEYMKENAPWEDRTGDAREGLSATVFHTGFRHEIVLAYDVDYGIWLEVRWDGEYAIIGPTIDHYSAIIMGELSFSAEG